jgi:ketosteroid isomerase-like protein
MNKHLVFVYGTLRHGSARAMPIRFPGSKLISYDEAKAHVYGNAAVVNYILIVKGRDKEGKDYANRYRNTVVWVTQQGHWRMAAIHVSRIRP